MVESLLEKDVHPKVITYSMSLVSSEFGFLSTPNKKEFYSTLVEAIVEASNSINEDKSISDIPVETKEEEIIERGDETLH